MNEVRIMFEKAGRSAYISHLDLMRTFQRVFVRAGVALRHSEGFSPHPKMSVIIPLPLGCRGYGEFLDVELKSPVNPAELPARINAFMPEGIKALDAAEPIMKPGRIKFALWKIEVIYSEANIEDLAREIEDLLSRESLIISRKTKRGLSDFDLAPYTGNLSVSFEDDRINVKGILPAQEPSVNPALIMTAVKKFLPDYAPLSGVSSRITLFDESMSNFK